MKTAGLALAAVLVAACTGTIDGGGLGSPDATSSSTSGPPDGSAGGERNPAPGPNDGSDASPDAPPGEQLDAGLVCQTSVDSYGYTRCVCSPGVHALGDAAVAACVGYDCCVSYGPDSGLAAGFGDPTLSSDLCACFHSADIAALRGTTATCSNFAHDGVGTVVKACP